MLRSMWDLPRAGLKPVSPALAGRFLTTVPPGKSRKNIQFFNKKNCLTFGSPFAEISYYIIITYIRTVYIAKIP